MKTLIMKLLGLNTLAVELDLLKKQNEESQKQIKDLTDEVNAFEEKLGEIEIPDMDDYVLNSDLDNDIESYLNNNDYATQCWVEENVNEAIENNIDTDSIADDVLEKVNDDLEEKVRDLFNDASPAPMSEEAIQSEIRKAIAEILSKAYDNLKKQG